MPQADDTANSPTKPRRSRKALVAIILLLAGLLAAGGTIAYFVLELDAANTRIIEQNEEIKEQRKLIDRKEVFGASFTSLLNTAAEFEGQLVGALVPIDRYETAAARAWDHRWNPKAMDRDIAAIAVLEDDLSELLSSASVQATTNTTGSTYESVIDSLGSGFVASLIDDADSLCEADVIACVVSDDPYTVHFDAADNGLEYMNDVLRTGVAYHEFAHVLQMSNPEPTETALEAFADDSETMADCYALTYLDGWKLDHRIWVSSYEYWDVSIGYGHVCDATQRAAVVAWHDSLAFHLEPISQDS